VTACSPGTWGPLQLQPPTTSSQGAHAQHKQSLHSQRRLQSKRPAHQVPGPSPNASTNYPSISVSMLNTNTVSQSQRRW
jgi:hypothetical protein